MYIPRHFEESREAVLHALIREHPLGALVISGPEGLEANHLPFELDTEQGVLRAHVARANPLWRAAPCEALAIFQGPSAYISPSFYPGKAEHGRAVPTWNYIAVHAGGPLRVVDDPAWLRALVDRLTNRFEAGRPAPWKLDDAPDDYLHKLLGQIVGIELKIARIAGKWKMSQNQPEANRAGVEQGLRAEGGGAADVAEHMARLG